jgi:hypothetical protein
VPNPKLSTPTWRERERERERDRERERGRERGREREREREQDQARETVPQILRRKQNTHTHILQKNHVGRIASKILSFIAWED